MEVLLRAVPARRSGVDESARPVFLVQGFASNVRLLRPLERYLQRRGRPTFCPCPVLGLGDIRHAALRVYDAIEHAASSGRFEAADLIGHSMGGIVAAYVLKQLDRGRRVSRVIALGSPFRGMDVARLGALLLGPFACSLRQLSPGSPLLRLLSALPVPPGCRLVSVAGAKDWLVPDWATHLPATPGHEGLVAGPLDHWDLLRSRSCFAHVARALERPLSRGGREDGSPLAA